jgi:hypothetical protein
MYNDNKMSKNSVQFTKQIILNLINHHSNPTELYYATRGHPNSYFLNFYAH